MDSLLRTPAKKVIREHIQNIKEEATISDAIAAFHAAGISSASGTPNGKVADSFTVTVTGGPPGSFQKAQHDIDRNLKAKGLRLVSVQYHENPSTGETTHTCVVKAPVTI